MFIDSLQVEDNLRMSKKIIDQDSDDKIEKNQKWKNNMKKKNLFYILILLIVVEIEPNRQINYTHKIANQTCKIHTKGD